mmetsp:Transcript_36179/g.106859  ORF Transcript_36179/g.106859 Transcript_36179/m.106859 type:complete len:141 (-) Transcript_36179:250-672(-)
MARYTLSLLLCGLLAAALVATASASYSDVTELEIETTFKPDGCDIAKKAAAGDKIGVHYKGMLTSGKEFDSSYKRNRPFSFKLGGGQVIKGWDQGLMGACVGEKRLLKIPPSLGYGEAGAGGVIPGGATLIFETEVTALD